MASLKPSRFDTSKSVAEARPGTEPKKNKAPAPGQKTHSSGGGSGSLDKDYYMVILNCFLVLIL